MSLIPDLCWLVLVSVKLKISFGFRRSCFLFTTSGLSMTILKNHPDFSLAGHLCRKEKNPSSLFNLWISCSAWSSSSVLGITTPKEVCIRPFNNSEATSQCLWVQWDKLTRNWLKSYHNFYTERPNLIKQNSSEKCTFKNRKQPSLMKRENHSKLSSLWNIKMQSSRRRSTLTFWNNWLKARNSLKNKK